MNMRACFAPGNRSARPSTFLWKMLWLGLASVAPAAAQDVLVAPPPVSTAPSAVQEHQNSSPMQVFSPAQSAPNFSGFSQPFQWGPVTARPHLDYQFSYGNGISSSPGEQQDTIVQQFSPGVLFDVGSHWTLDYTPTLVFYSSSAFRNTVDHSVSLGWGTAYNNWFFSGSQGCVLSSDPNVQTAGQNDTQTYSTAFNASYQINSEWSLALGVNQFFNYVGTGQSSTNLFQNLGSSRGWSTMDWLNYTLWTRLTVGAGVGFGYNQQENSPDSAYEQYQAQASWRLTDKISLQLNGGLEDQQYLNSGSGDLVTPIFGAALQYQPFAQTRISVSASRSVSPSYFQNQTTESSSVTGDLNQRLLGRLYLDIGGGYSSTKYVASAPGLSTDRSDDTYSFNTRLTCPFPKRGTFSIFYQYSKNVSNQAGFAAGSSAFSYSSSQVGFEIGYSY